MSVGRGLSTYDNITMVNMLRSNIMKRSKASKPRGRGRPKNIDTATLFSTTLPESVLDLLQKLSEAQHRTKSEIITDAVRGYARRFQDLINA